jgi:hypothetical protein
MVELFLTPHSLPFAIALTVVIGLFILEILSAVVGTSIMGIDVDGPDLDIDTDFDMSIDGGVDIPEIEAELADGPSGILSWLGAREVPFLIWLVSFLTMFGLIGLFIQATAISIIGTPLYATAAAMLAFVPAVGLTRIISNWVALLMPKTESSAMRMRFLGGHRGVITQGTAARGKPAEAKIKDRHGNFHYLRVEPLDDDETFPQGSDVTLIRKRGDKFFVI